MKKNKWFEEVFLPSFDKNMNNPKYPNKVILSPKQEDVCIKNMSEKQCHGDYGYFTVYEYKTESANYLLTFSGKYTFLHKRPL